MIKRQQPPKFSLEQDELLIKFVRENGPLYDLSHKKYSDTVYKNTLWKKIGEILQLDAQHCKHRWESIRGQYRKMLKCRQTKTGQTRSKWKYEDILQFLKPHMKENERWISIVSTESLSVPADDEEEPSVRGGAGSVNPKWEFSADDVVEEASQLISKPIKGKTDHNPSAPTASSTMMKFSLQQESKQHEAKDELDYFFETIKSTVKKFSPADTHLAKNKIFMIVSDIESKYVDKQFT